MKLERIVSLANAKSRIPFLAMERSLRAAGCTLPLDVIPYDTDLFDLPAGSRWWKIEGIWDWLRAENAHRMMHKYQCLTIGAYHYVDSDICFVRNPQTALEPYDGWVSCCSDWNHPQWTFTSESAAIMSRQTSLWKRTVFNAGQFACDRPLHDEQSLKQTVLRPDFINTCLRCTLHDQPGMNLLIFESKVKFTNLTLPPHNMESSWAADYPDADYQRLWTDPQRAPYLIHWAGNELYNDRPINQVFHQYLTTAERREWDEHVKQKRIRDGQAYRDRLSWMGKRIFDVKQVAVKSIQMATGRR
jgi:hypothetical protein